MSSRPLRPTKSSSWYPSTRVAVGFAHRIWMPWSITRMTSVCSLTNTRNRSSLSARELVASLTITAARRSLRRPRCAIANRRKLTKIPKPSSRFRGVGHPRRLLRRRHPQVEAERSPEHRELGSRATPMLSGFVFPNTSVWVTRCAPARSALRDAQSVQPSDAFDDLGREHVGVHRVRPSNPGTHRSGRRTPRARRGSRGGLRRWLRPFP